MKIPNYFEFLKHSSTFLESMNKSLLVKNLENKIEGFLLPVSNLDIDDKNSILLLMNWRNTHSYAYPLKTSVTEESTKEWLQDIIFNNNSKILFWVIDLNGNKIGHVGLVLNKENNLELDNILRGNNSSSKGIISKSINALEFFIETELQLSRIYLKVLQSNKHAVDFYTKLNYREIDKISLKIETLNEITRLTPGNPAEDYFVVMHKDLERSRQAANHILTAGPQISSFESSFVLDATLNGWNDEHSKYIKIFESEFAQLIGSKFAITTSSCTGALHLALLALGVGQGDEVIIPELTWVATASAVRYVGATPVFADVDSKTWTLCEESLRSLINEKTRAIIPVHLYGYPANMDSICRIAADYDIKIIEDAAPAVGATFDRKHVGTFGDFGCFSFQGAKMLVTGEGGMLVTNDEDLFKKAWKFQDHGRKPGTFWIDQIGYKYKMSNLQAAFGLGQLKRIENQIQKKRKINEWYREDLKDIGTIRFQSEFTNSKSICWMTSIEISDDCVIDRDTVIQHLYSNGIDSRPVFPAISQYPIWNKKQQANTIAKKIGDSSINLPSGVLLSRNSVSKVSEVLRRILKSD